MPHLDMRMDYQNDEIETAADVLNDYDEESIANAINMVEEKIFQKNCRRNC